MNPTPDHPRIRSIRFYLAECSGSLGDLGTFLPLAAALAITNNLDLSVIFLFAGLMNIATGLMFRLPVPVQPMKAIAAVAIAEGLTPGDVAASGIAIGSIFAILALTGAMNRIDKLVPQPVIRGIQAGVGAALVHRGILWSLELPATGTDSILTVVILALLILIASKRAAPIILIIFAAGVILAWKRAPFSPDQLFAIPNISLTLPSPSEWATGITRGAIPQLPLTLLNSVLAVCALSGDLFPNRAIQPKRMAISVALMNLLCVPFGAMPMCHGSGGLAAQHRFGARTGASVVILGVAKVIFALVFAASILPMISAYPQAILAVMIIFAGFTLMKPAADTLSARSPAAIMLITAISILLVGTLEGFIAGCIAACILARRPSIPGPIPPTSP